VVEGSPKGASSITLQPALYLEKLVPADGFDVLRAGQQTELLGDRGARFLGVRATQTTTSAP
jgi:hypothetical protein